MSKDSKLPHIKVGQQWKTRGGSVMTVIRDDGSSMAYFTSAGTWHYKDGCMWSEGFYPRDLVELIEDVEASFNPLAARDRIKEIDALREQIDAERAQLIEDLRQAGFELVANCRHEQPQDVPEPKDWKHGDIVECITETHYFSVGNEYKVLFDGTDLYGYVRIYSGAAEFRCCKPALFRWLRRPE